MPTVASAPQSAFKAAARVTQRPAPKLRRSRKARRGGGTRARSFTTAALAEDYLRLCRDPLRDLQRWMDEDKKRGRAGRGAQLITKKEEHAQTTTTAANSLAEAFRPRGEPLLELQGGLDADGQGGGVLTVCLLDREQVLADMTGCNRFEPMESPEAG